MDTQYLTPRSERIAGLMALMLLLLMAGCAAPPRPTTRPVTISSFESTEMKFKEAARLSDQGKIEKALAIYYSISLSQPDTLAQGRAWYQMGRLYMKKGYTHLAEERFKRVAKRYPHTVWADSSLLELAWIAHEKREEPAAARYLQQIDTSRLNSLQVESYKRLQNILSYQPSSHPSWEEESSQTPATQGYGNATVQNHGQEMEGEETTGQVAEEKPLPSSELPPSENGLPPEYLREKAAVANMTAIEERKTRETGAVIGLWISKDKELARLRREIRRGAELAVHHSGLKLVESERLDSLLSTKNLVGVVGGLKTFGIQKAMHLLEEQSLPLITPFVRVPHLPAISPLLFSTSYSLTDEAAFVAQTGRDRGLTTAGVLYPDIPFGRALAESFKIQWERMGGTMVFFRSYPEGTIDFTGIFDKMKDRGKVPQFLFLPCDWTEARLIIPQVAYHELEGVTVMGVSLWDMSSHLSVSEEEETPVVLFSDTFSRVSLYLPAQEFVMRYLQRYKSYPSPLSAQAYDAARALVLWYRRGMNTPLSQLRMTGITGLAGFTSTGEPLRRPYLLRITDKGVEQLN